jgi:hypothetical protein
MRMMVESNTFFCVHLLGEYATHPLTRPAKRLPLSLLLAGMSLPRRRFVAATRLNAPSGASNCGF